MSDPNQVMRLTYTQRAAEHERFAPDAFDRAVGTMVPITFEGMPTGLQSKVISATVAEDGKSVEFTLEHGGALVPPAEVRP